MDHHRSTAVHGLPLAHPGRPSWQRMQLHEEAGVCYTDHLALNDGSSLIYVDYTPVRDLHEASLVERDARALTLSVALQGRSSTRTQDGERFDFVEGHSTVAAFKVARGHRYFAAGQTVRQLRLVVPEPVLDSYGLACLLECNTASSASRPLYFGKHSGAVRALAESLVALRTTGGSLLDTQIAALSLLAEQARAQAVPASAPAGGALRGQDQDKLLRARDILRQHYDRPLTLAYLCAAVGTNEFKLKQGFRQMFGTTVHRMLTDIRMRHAWELLQTGLYASTVAYRVGYRHPSSFSTAFERYYGRTPKSVETRQPT